jgi:hypothetical protein
MEADEMLPEDPQFGNVAAGPNPQPRPLTSEGLESSETVVLLDQLRLDSHKIILPLDADGQGYQAIPVAWERVISIVPMATRDRLADGFIAGQPWQKKRVKRSWWPVARQIAPPRLS